MKVYMVCDDWTGESEYYQDFDRAMERQRERFDAFFTSQELRMQRRISIDDFWIEEITVL